MRHIIMKRLSASPAAGRWVKSERRLGYMLVFRIDLASLLIILLRTV